VCQIFSRSVHGLRSSDTPTLSFPIDLLRRPYNSVRTAVRHCDSTVFLFYTTFQASVSAVEYDVKKCTVSSTIDRKKSISSHLSKDIAL